jgi:hypothetical protein
MSKSIDATNAIEESKLGNIAIDKINFNLFPEILIHHHDEFVEPKGMKKHFKKHFEKPKLRELIEFIAEFINKHPLNSSTFPEYLIQRMAEYKVITQDDFDELLKNTRTVIETCNTYPADMDVLIENNKKAEKTLNILKTRIQEGNFLYDDEERFFQFCQLEYDKNKIYETGIVPLGWLPSDVSDMSSLLEKVGITLDQQAEMTNRLRNYAIGNSMLHMSGSMKR